MFQMNGNDVILLSIDSTVLDSTVMDICLIWNDRLR